MNKAQNNFLKFRLIFLTIFCISIAIFAFVINDEPLIILCMASPILIMIHDLIKLSKRMIVESNCYTVEQILTLVYPVSISNIVQDFNSESPLFFKHEVEMPNCCKNGILFNMCEVNKIISQNKIYPLIFNKYGRHIGKYEPFLAAKMMGYKKIEIFIESGYKFDPESILGTF